MRTHFGLTLKQDGTKISGFHSVVLNYGALIDNWGTNSINGSIKNGIAIISIQSGRAKNPGTAKIKHIGKDSILFVLTKRPTDGDPLLLDSIILTKRKQK